MSTDDEALRAAAAAIRAERAGREPTPPTLRRVLGDVVRALPPQARHAYENANTAEQRAAAAADEAAARAEAIEAVRAAQRANRDAAWAACVPRKYRDVRLDNLRPQQDRHHRRDRATGAFVPAPGTEGSVTGWLDSGKITLVLAGPSRRGKTAAAYAIGHAARERGLWTLAYSAPVLMDLARPSAPDKGTAWHHALHCDLLIVDDLGRDRETEWSLERWHVLLDGRLSAERRTIVTTNESQDTLRARYGETILRRIVEGSTSTVARIEGDVLGDDEEDAF